MNQEFDTLLSKIENGAFARSKSNSDFLAEIFSEYPIEEIIEALAKVFWWKRAFIAKELLESSVLAVNQKPDGHIKTVGMFFHKLRNGGTENVMARLADVLAGVGMQLVIFTEEEPSLEDYPLTQPFLRVVLPVVREGESYRPRTRALLNALEENQVDCMVWHAWMLDTTLWDLIAIKHSGARIICYVHSSFCFPALTAPWLYQYEMPAIYALFDAVATLSRVDAAYWRNFNSNVYCVHQVLRDDLLQKHIPSTNNCNLLWLGRLSAEKNYHDLIMIMKCIVTKVPRANLTIVGATPDDDYSAFEQEIIENDLVDNIMIAGFTTDISKYYAEASMFILTSVIEGFPLALTESKGYSLPCVMYDLPYLEWVRDGSGIITVPQGDTIGFADAVVNLLVDSESYEKASRAAYSSLERYLAASDIASEWQTIFASLATDFKTQTCVQQIDPDFEETQKLLWQTNNHYTELGIRTYVAGKNREVSERDKWLVERDKWLEQQRLEYETSVSYRIGRAITALPRIIREALQNGSGKK